LRSIADLVDLLEVIALDHVHEDDRGLVVALVGPCDRLRIGDALECQAAQGGDDIGTPQRAVLALRGLGDRRISTRAES
jgi:hypothetical protein